MVVEKVIELGRRRKAGVEAFYCEEEATAVSFQAGRLHEAGTVQSRGVGIRVFADGRIGYASTNDLDRLEETVESALGAARYGRTFRSTLFAADGSILPHFQVVINGRPARLLGGVQSPIRDGDTVSFLTPIGGG